MSTAAERVALRGSLSAMLDTATWDERGRVYPTPQGVSTTRLLAELAVAWRPRRDVELSLLWGAGVGFVEARGVSSREALIGDVTARARWEALDHRGWRLAPFFSLRCPTGDTTGGTLSTGVAGLGLGAWELSPGVELSWHDVDRGSVGVLVDVGLRVTSASWWPGPRVTAGVFGAWRATRVVTLTASVSHVWEGDASREGVVVADSGARRLAVGLGAGLRHDAVLWTLSVGVDPWVEQLGANATSTLRLTFGATWGLPR